MTPVVFIGALVVIGALHLPGTYEPPMLLPAISLVCFAGGSLLAAVLAGRAYLAGSSGAVLCLGCGLLMFGSACLSGSGLLALGEPNAGISAHNLGALLSGILQAAGVLTLTLRPYRAVRSRGNRLAVAGVFTLGIMGAITLAAWARVFPPFVTSTGTTPLRTIVLTATTVVYLFAAIHLALLEFRKNAPFLRWYWLGLLLVAIGIAGVGMGRVGSAMSWTGRLAQAAAQCYFVVGLLWLMQQGGRLAMAHAFLDLQQAIDASENRFQAAYENAAIGIDIMDLQGRYLDGNEILCRLLDYTPEQLRRCTFQQITHPDDLAREQPMLDDLLADRRSSYCIEKRYLRRDGQSVWVRVTSSMALTPVPYRISIIEDITRRKQAEEALQENQARLEAVFAAIPHGIVEYDAQLRTVRANEPALRTLGMDTPQFDRDQAIHILQFRTLDGTPIDRANLPSSRALRGEVVAGMPFLIRTADGRDRVVSTYAAPLFKEGQISGVVALWHDVTDLKRAEERAQAIRARLEAALASMTDAVFISDLNGRFIDFNDAFATFHRFKDKQECATTLMEYPEILDVFMADGTLAPTNMWAVPRALRGETASNAEYTLRRKDTGETWVGSYSFAPIRDASGAIVGSVVVGRDVTDEKHAEQALQESHEELQVTVEELQSTQEELLTQNHDLLEARAAVEHERWRYQDLFDAAPDGYVVTDTQGDVLQANNVALCMMALIPQQAERSSLSRFIDADSQAQFESALSLLRAGGQVQSLELRIRSAAGAVVDAEISASPEKSAGLEREARIRWLIRDASERKRAEAERNHLSEQRQIALDAARLGWWRYNPVTRMASYDDRYREIFDVTGAEKPNDEILDRLHPDDLPGVWAKVQAALNPADPQPYAAEYRVFRRDGSIRWVEAHGAAAFIGEGAARRATDFVGTVQDITERKRIQDTLLESELFYRQMMESIPGMVFTTRPDGYCDYQSQQWVEYTGVPMSEHVGDGWNQLLHPEDRPRAFAAWQAAVDGKAPYDLEYRVRRHDGEYEWFKVIGRPIHDQEGRIVRWFGVALNIEVLKQAERARAHLTEAERAARMEAEKANRLKDEFLATVSHELRNPLNVIVGWNRLLAGGSVPVGKAVDIIGKSAATLTQIVADLLDMSRIVSGKTHLQLEQVDLASLINGVLDGVRLAADAKSVTVDSSLDPDLEPITCDPNRVQQIVSNLLSNAIKFTPQGGRVTVSIKQLEGAVQIAVKDNGQGIAVGFLPHIFDRFRQADGSVGRHHGGLGLGLSIVKNLVDLHGGTVRAESAGVGKGARFIVILPVQAATSPARPATPPAESAELEPSQHAELEALRGKKILVVDDDAANCELVSRVLDETGAVVRTATSGDAAFEHLSHEIPDLLISDIGMPGMTGYELVEKIRKTQGMDALTCIALTAFSRPEDRQEALAAGFDAHLSKPFSPAQLAGTLKALSQSET